MFINCINYKFIGFEWKGILRLENCDVILVYFYFSCLKFDGKIKKLSLWK